MFFFTLFNACQLICVLLQTALPLLDVRVLVYAKIIGPRMFGDTSSYRLFLATEAKKPNLSQPSLASTRPLWPFIECTKRGDLRCWHKTEEVQIFFYLSFFISFIFLFSTLWTYTILFLVKIYYTIFKNITYWLLHDVLVINQS